MKAVLLDEDRFAEDIQLTTPEALSELVRFKGTPQDNAVIIERCQDADIVIVGSLRIEREVIEALHNLKLLQVTSVGTNQVDIKACEDNAVKVLNVPGFATATVAEHTFMLLLNAMRAGVNYHNKVKDGSWKQQDRADMMNADIIDLENLTLGLIGVGDIGKRVSKIAEAYGMKVLWAEHKGETPRNDSYTEFDTVLAESDVISLHCPLTEKTKHLIDDDAISKMAKTPIVINVARGKVVDTQALAKAIKAEKVLGFATDVFEREPADINDPIVQLANQPHPRVILSPHVGAASKASQVKLWEVVRNQVNQFVKESSK
ncbi:NAD(P)-dependent oxidoreductase [Psychrobacter sp.]|uniref:NAD(P)-dependent oxidoreductase n=1 Tax=Psychrobacter sp. TaxID=56811 RepID=UPI0025E9A16B|nr:NAD(P)-dependent oxidoreductase [Psychrobacter sp.]